MIIVLNTNPNMAEAEMLAKKIIEAKLAACVQILPKIKSFYFWKDKIEEDAEYLLLIKTLEDNFTELETFINKNHSYDVPEIVALEAKDVSESYLDWIKDTLKRN